MYITLRTTYTYTPREMKQGNENGFYCKKLQIVKGFSFLAFLFAHLVIDKIGSMGINYVFEFFLLALNSEYSKKD